MIDQAELARRCARPDATLPDFVHARGRHLAGNGHAGEEAAVYILDRKLQELLHLRGQAAQNVGLARIRRGPRSEEHTSELQSLMRISYAVFCLKKKKKKQQLNKYTTN